MEPECRGSVGLRSVLERVTGEMVMYPGGRLKQKLALFGMGEITVSVVKMKGPNKEFEEKSNTGRTGIRSREDREIGEKSLNT